MNDAATKGVLLAIAILLLWLAGLSFFIAFEGSKILGQTGADAPSEVDKLKLGLSQAIQDQAAKGVPA